MGPPGRAIYTSVVFMILVNVKIERCIYTIAKYLRSNLEESPKSLYKRSVID